MDNLLDIKGDDVCDEYGIGYKEENGAPVCVIRGTPFRMMFVSVGTKAGGLSLLEVEEIKPSSSPPVENDGISVIFLIRGMGTLHSCWPVKVRIPTEC